MTNLFKPGNTKLDFNFTFMLKKKLIYTLLLAKRLLDANISCFSTVANRFFKNAFSLKTWTVVDSGHPFFHLLLNQKAGNVNFFEMYVLLC